MAVTLERVLNGHLLRLHRHVRRGRCGRTGRSVPMRGWTEQEGTRPGVHPIVRHEDYAFMWIDPGG